MPTHARDELEWRGGTVAARTLGAGGQRHSRPTRVLLAPLSVLYRAAVLARNSAYDRGLLRTHRVDIPVISVGNIVAGGSGKTPFTRWLVERLLRRGLRVAVLHGGYADDEPALYRDWTPNAALYVGKDRVASARRAIELGAQVIVLDDGFQHRRLARTLDIVLIPTETNSEALLPLGPQREPSSALARAHLLVLTRKTASAENAAVRRAELIARWPDKTVAQVALLPAGVRSAQPGAAAQLQQPVTVVSGVARPDLFVRQLRDQGMRIHRVLAFPDHHAYSERDAQHIRQAAAQSTILTTEKDAVKLRPLLRQALWVVQQRVDFEHGLADLERELERVL